MAGSAPLQGDTGPIQTAANIVSTAMTMEMCMGLAQTISSPTAVNPVSLGMGAVAVAAVPKLLNNIL